MKLKNQIFRLFLAVFFLCVGAFAQELQYATITEEDLVAGRFMPLPAHLRNAGYFDDDDRQTRSETFEDVVVAGIKACQTDIDVSSFNISTSDIKSLYYAVINDHPELFYITTGMSYSYYSAEQVATVSPGYITTDSSTIASQQLEIDAAREQALGMLPEDASEVEKVLILHEYLATHCTYDTTLSRTNTRNIYGALVEKKVVCAGYAVAYEYLLEYDGVDVTCDYVTSTAMNHAWNMVTIGGQKYHVDVTWDDPTYSDGEHRCYVGHTNFLRSDTGIQATGHTGWDDTTTYTSTSTKYDSYFWQDSERQIPCWDGAAYAFNSSGNLKHYNLSSGSEVKTLLTVSDTWYIWEFSSSSWIGNYSGVVRFGNNLIYSDTESLHFYDLTDQESKDLSALSYTATGGYLYGIQHENVNLIAPNTAQSPHVAGSYTDIQLYPVTEVALDQTSLSLTKSSAAVTLTATVTPSNATYPDIRWTSSNTSVATVSDSGVVTPVANGTATITATAKDNGTCATCTVTVSSSPVTGVALNQSTAELKVGGEGVQLTATVAPENADDKSVTWSTSNSAVATVVDGLVSPVAKGSATITVTTTDGNFTATCDVTVTQPVTSVALNQSAAELKVGGDDLQLTATVAPEDASDPSVTWSSSNNAVATVSESGLVSPVGKGNATITVTTTDGGFTATCTVTVTQPVTSVTLNKSTAELKVGDDDLRLTATVLPYEASDKSVSWSCSDPNVATVSEIDATRGVVPSYSSMALVTAVGPGTATITVTTTDGEYTATCDVTVTQPVTGVALNQSTAELKVGGDGVQLSATVSPDNASDKSVTWTSSDSAVATVSNTGLVTPVAKGETTITVTTTDGGFTADCYVTVTQPVTGVTLSQSTAEVVVGSDGLRLTATVSPSDASNKMVTWTSSDSTVAGVVPVNGELIGVPGSLSGLVMPLKPGKATIQVTTMDGGFTATCEVTVKYTLFLKEGWNLVAFQMRPTNLSQFDGVTFYQHRHGQYVAVEEFSKNVAYWAFSAKEQTVIYYAEEFVGGTNPVLTSDWQFVGLSDEDLPSGLDNIECYEWQDGMFQKVDGSDELEVGHGYLMRKRE